MSTPSTQLTRELVQMACAAPSVHNTQPWAWRISEDAHVVELYADRSRQLTATDPKGRDLALSCGAALDHLEVAASAFGIGTEVALLPDSEQPDLLARVTLSGGRVDAEHVAMLAALENRLTDRRGFTDWEVPLGGLEHLAEAAVRPGVHVLPLTDPGDVAQAERLVEQARKVHLADPAVVAEREEWTRLATADGVPPEIADPQRRPGAAAPPDRYARRREPDPSRTDRRGALVAICTAKDDLRAWLEAGRALSRLWIGATRKGLMLVPLSQVVEVDETRRTLRHDVFEGMLRPQVLARVGWPESSRPEQSHTPRRPLAEVLLD